MNRHGTIREVAAKAFTFVEVMIALAIVSISLVALLGLHLRSLALVRAAQITSQAVLVADTKMAETLGCGYPELGRRSGTEERNSLTYDWRTEVSEAGPLRPDNVCVGGLRKVLVDVCWRDGPGRRHLRVSTYVADRNIGEDR